MRIVVLHAGGLGDLVLVESLLAALRAQHPGARVELICRVDVAPVAALYEVPPDAVYCFDFNPYRWSAPEIAVAESRPFLEALPRQPVDLFVSAELSATWLSEILAAEFEPSAAVFGDGSVVGRAVTRIVLRRLGKHLRPGIRRLPARNDEHELDRYARLVNGDRRLPRLRPLRDTRNDRERPLVLFPLGTPMLKQWPFAHLERVCRSIRDPADRLLLLVGSDAEAPALEELAAAFPGEHFATLTGGRTELAGIAAVIANADGYVGIDSGLAHLAAAYGVPGVTLYGGGTWPAYAPWGSRSAGVVAPIPCFGCGWDCAFDRAYCIEAVPVDEVVRAFHAVHSGSEHTLIVENEAYEPRERTLFAEASHVYRAAQADRRARLHAIVRLRDILERYALRSRTRQIGTSTALEHLTARLDATARRLRERAPSQG